MEPKVSVIVPIYNVENYLKQCLDSIKRQTLKEIEIICINDGSTDNSLDIMREYAKYDDRIISVNKKNGGYGAACNIGLNIAKGRYIAILEPDDFVENTMYEELYMLGVKHNADVVKSPFYEHTDYNNKPKSKIIEWDSMYEMPEKVFVIKDCPQLFYFHPSIWSGIYKREFLNNNNIRFKEAKGAAWVDNPFQVKTMCLAERIFYTPKAYYHYRLTNPTSSSNVLNISNPFDRSDEIHNFLNEKKIKDENLLAHLYKRELGYIDKVLGSVNNELFDTAVKKITELVNNMDKKIIHTNKRITEKERIFYNKCTDIDGIKDIMKSITPGNNILIVDNV